MAVNVRLGKEEDKALRCKGEGGNDDDGYRGRGGRGRGEKGKRFVEWSLSW